MRQRQQSPLDGQLRTALENMRFGACTDADILFLRGRIACDRPGYPHIEDKKFRDVSIITAINVHKDVINEHGPARFAHDNGQELTHFYSVDSLSSQAVSRDKWKGCEQAKFSSIGPKLRQALWDAPPSTTTEHIPGCLSICVGMPVMLKTNDATELCITKGQEGFVVGWDSNVGPNNQKILDNLFVKLANPPRTISIPGLPDNVVPMSRTSRHTTALLQDDSLLSLNREQVLVLPNFAMTDYGSQGKSRDPNVVHLNNCRDHRAYYVALSRGHKAENTVILQGFDSSKITSGMSGYLRQEFRELELLDEITRLRFKGELPGVVRGVFRRELLQSYKHWKGPTHRDPAGLHAALQYRAHLDTDEEPVDYGTWIPTIKPSRKRKAPSSDNAPNKKPNTGPMPLNDGTVPSAAFSPKALGPIGLIWDSVNYSCAYDSLFTCLLYILQTDQAKWTQRLVDCSNMLGVWAMATSQNMNSPEQARNMVRELLYFAQPLNFPKGRKNIGLDALFMAMTSRKDYAGVITYCERCNFREPGVSRSIGQYQDLSVANRLAAEHPEGVGINKWYEDHLDNRRKICPQCKSNGFQFKMRTTTTIEDLPPLIIMTTSSVQLVLEDKLNFVVNGTHTSLKLTGLIYHSASALHFSSVIVDVLGRLWHHDGITTQRGTVYIGHLRDMPDRRSLHFLDTDKRLCAAIYAQD
ncbi:hypothetical protein K438DRAFT_1607251 [Mycena galopus ATCC 62051]|nr:hypothetical protein K438DRAFT_1607251 [Mycena galopus ATCC 62051]